LVKINYNDSVNQFSKELCVRRISKVMTALMLMTSFSAFAVNCEKLKQRAESAKRAGKAARLNDKYQALCVDKVSKDEWKQKKQANKSQYKCANLKQRLEKVSAKGKQGRAAKIQQKLADLGCQ
jgi:hypothetical protein